MRRWALSVLLGIDQLGHVILSPVLFYRIADPDETISSRLGKLRREHGKIPWRYPIARGIDWILERIDQNHSLDSIEDDER